MLQHYPTITKLISRYDYGGALELLSETNMHKTDAGILMHSCRYAVNFDFKTAKKLLYELSEEAQNHETIRYLKANLKNLIAGDTQTIFSEMMENIKFQVVNDEYIDFLGRVYRCKEAIFKYMFVTKQMGTPLQGMLVKNMEKRQILKVLRSRYRIYNTNVVFGVQVYFNKYARDEYKCHEVIRILSTDKMNDLIELRHDSIVGHGFVGVSIDDINGVYGNPFHVLDDFNKCFSLLDINVEKYKYSRVNDTIGEFLKDAQDVYSRRRYTEQGHFE